MEVPCHARLPAPRAPPAVHGATPAGAPAAGTSGALGVTSPRWASGRTWPRRRSHRRGTRRHRPCAPARDQRGGHRINYRNQPSERAVGRALPKEAWPRAVLSVPGASSFDGARRAIPLLRRGDYGPRPLALDRWWTLHCFRRASSRINRPQPATWVSHHRSLICTIPRRSSAVRRDDSCAPARRLRRAGARLRRASASLRYAPPPGTGTGSDDDPEHSRSTTCSSARRVGGARPASAPCTAVNLEMDEALLAQPARDAFGNRRRGGIAVASAPVSRAVSPISRRPSARAVCLEPDASGPAVRRATRGSLRAGRHTVVPRGRERGGSAIAPGLKGRGRASAPAPSARHGAELRRPLLVPSALGGSRPRRQGASRQRLVARRGRR